MSETVFFADVAAHRANADALFERVEARLRTLLPSARIEHVGSTAQPDGLTKGDLDVQVRVHADAFDEACRVLALEYAPNPGGFIDQGKSFKDDNTTPPLGVHVTIIGGPSDIQHWQRALLRARPDLRAEYDALKRRFNGGDMDAYRDAKDAFFTRVAQLVVKPMVELVIFDCDGVLVDSEVLSNHVLAQLLTEEGLPTTLADARHKYQGLLLAEVVRDVEAQLGRKLPDGWLAQYERQRTEVFRRELKPIVGAIELATRVRAAGLKMCVASQGKLEKTQLSLQLTGLRALFADGALFSAYSVARGKPHPDLFLHAAATMGVNPDKCVVVEDTVLGVRAAASAGMFAFGFAADSDASALQAAGARVVHKLDEVGVQLGL